VGKALHNVLPVFLELDLCGHGLLDVFYKTAAFPALLHPHLLCQRHGVTLHSLHNLRKFAQNPVEQNKRKQNVSFFLITLFLMIYIFQAQQPVTLHSLHLLCKFAQNALGKKM
jgi:hypothetical protein